MYQVNIGISKNPTEAYPLAVSVNGAHYTECRSLRDAWLVANGAVMGLMAARAPEIDHVVKIDERISWKPGDAPAAR